MNQPVAAASTATIVPARYALTMNGRDHMSWTSAMRFHEKAGSLIAPARSSVPVAVVGRRLRLSDDDEPPVGGPEHLDRDAVERGEHLRGDHLVRRTADGAALAEVDDPVQV